MRNEALSKETFGAPNFGFSTLKLALSKLCFPTLLPFEFISYQSNDVRCNECVSLVVS